MSNLEVVDNNIKRLRSILDVYAKTKAVKLTTDDLLNFLSCMERLSVIEKHLINLVSAAYEYEIKGETHA